MTEKKRPNILFIMTDEQRFDTFSHVNKDIKTPEIDRLIKDSIFFKNAYCSNPSCIPSRAAIMTGKFPTQCQVPTYITYLPEDEITFMNRLRHAGYHTAVVGKQHFAETNIDKGYDEEWIVDGHSPTAKDASLYKAYIKGVGLEGQKHSDDSLIIGGEWQWPMAHHIDSFVASLGMDWLKQQKAEDEQDQPWFFTLSFPGPHQPYDCEGTEYAEAYALADMHLAETTEADLANKPPHFMAMNPKTYTSKYDEATFRKTKRAYYANMTLIDEKVGQVVALLKDKGLYDNTLILYTADHGDFMGDFGLVSKAQYLSEGLMRVPLFVKPPIPGFKGFDTEDKVLNIDLAATCLDVAEGRLGYGMSDYSWSDYWHKDKAPRQRDYIFMEAGGMKAIIKEGIKVVHYQGRSYGELYDLNKDPIEKFNLWNDPSYETYKNDYRALIIDQMIAMTPKSEVAWNHKAPEI